MGSDEQKEISFNYEAASGELDKSVKMELQKVEQHFLNKKDVKTVQATMGGNGMQEMLGLAKDATVTVTYNDDMKNFDAVKEKEEKYMNQLQSKGQWTEGQSRSGEYLQIKLVMMYMVMIKKMFNRL